MVQPLILNKALIFVHGLKLLFFALVVRHSGNSFIWRQVISVDVLLLWLLIFIGLSLVIVHCLLFMILLLSFLKENVKNSL